jgi:hypothetical protein
MQIKLGTGQSSGANQIGDRSDLRSFRIESRAPTVTLDLSPCSGVGPVPVFGRPGPEVRGSWTRR